jgi:hypothetical protein
LGRVIGKVVLGERLFNFIRNYGCLNYVG